jgi:hypothetical protein
MALSKVFFLSFIQSSFDRRCIPFMIEVVHWNWHIQARVSVLPCYLKMVSLDLFYEVFVNGRMWCYWLVNQGILREKYLRFCCTVRDTTKEVFVINLNCLLEVLVPSSICLCIVWCCVEGICVARVSDIEIARCRFDKGALFAESRSIVIASLIAHSLLGVDNSWMVTKAKMSPSSFHTIFLSFLRTCVITCQRSCSETFYS